MPDDDVDDNCYCYYSYRLESLYSRNVTSAFAY